MKSSSIMALSAGLVIPLALFGLRMTESPQAPSADRRSLNILSANQNDPLVTPCNGTKETLTEAKLDAKFPLFFPNDSVADSQNFETAWDCPGDGVVLAYSTGVRVDLTENTYADPSAVYKEMASVYPEFSVGTIRGHPANLIDPTKSPDHSAPGGVDFVEDNVRVTVVGNGEISLETLIGVANSLKESP